MTKTELETARAELAEAKRGTHGDTDVLLCRIAETCLNALEKLQARVDELETRQ